MKRFVKLIGLFFLILLMTLVGFVIYVQCFVKMEAPSIDAHTMRDVHVQILDNTRLHGQNWMRQDETGIWEMYISGAPFDRGYSAGLMCPDLLDFQEEVFVQQVETFVPNRLYRYFLLNAIQFYNRNLDEYIPLEYKKEIYGVSRSAPKQFENLGTNYERKITYHGAHDVGHAFQNMGFISGCTALAVIDSASGDLLLGRNFDFYVSDDFAKNKVVTCIRPDSGYALLSIAWAGMMGVVSGINEKGLAVVLNAGPSEMPKGARTPVTLIAREILQYAGTINEAIEIANRRDVFVSENFVIASGSEYRTVVIEKSPGATTLYETTPGEFACTNHFLSSKNQHLEANTVAKSRTSSATRFDQVQRLIKENNANDILDLVKILRTTSGNQGQALGLGNEMAINQLTGHHSIIFNTNKKKVYIACTPGQIGPFVMYDLNKIFTEQYKSPQRLWLDSIPADPLLFSDEFVNFQKYRSIKNEIQFAINNNKEYFGDLESFKKLNSEHYETYWILGQYFDCHGDKEQALSNYSRALKKEIPWAIDREKILEALNQLQ